MSESAAPFVDRLRARIAAVGAPVCVGIDPVAEKLPAELAPHAGGAEASVAAIERYVRGVIEAVAQHAACVKLQSACFERYQWHGVRVYHEMIALARQAGLLVIADAKRGDIGVSAEHYAAGCLADGALPGPDAITLSGYLGGDSIEPFVTVAATQGKGLFVLVRTSNPGGDEVQNVTLAQGGTLGDHLARLVAGWGDAEGCVSGSSGDSLVGAVVGATKPTDAARLRRIMPRQWFLVPGFGAQGAGVDDVRPCFRADGSGALITASRSVIYAYHQAGGDWRCAVADAAAAFNRDLRRL